MRAELWTDTGYVAGFDLPPFIVPPGIVTWGSRDFAGASGVRHLPSCTTVVNSDLDPKPACNCGGVFAYLEVIRYVVQDPQQIEKGRDRPITKQPGTLVWNVITT